MLQNLFDSVMRMSSREAVLAETLSLAQRLGFDRVTLSALQDRPAEAMIYEYVDNTPVAHRPSFVDSANCRRDPVLQHCKRSSLPIAWDQQTYAAVGLGDKWDEQAPHGYRTGIALALHLPEGRHLMLGLDRFEPLPELADEVARLAADMHLFALYAVDAVHQALLSPVLRAIKCQLTPRELECLRWTMEGKTAWEVGAILAISEQTAVRHLNNASRKLDCVHKHQAVVKALRLGMIR